MADGLASPFRPASFDAVLLDAPCSGLGALRRRPDARWRIQPGDVANLASLQADLLKAAAGLVRPGGTLVYSVCTLTSAETTGPVEAALAAGDLDGFEPQALPEGEWRPLEGLGNAAILLPGDDHDGMGISLWMRTT